nr:RecName: Full=Cold shock protein CSI5; AltName: Full=11 kDa cold shock protein [Bacillus subtilis]
MRNIKVKPFLN